MSILVNAQEHREAVSKAAHRRSESNVTATYGHRAEINQHARSGGVRTAGSSTPVSIGNQRTLGGSGPAANASHRSLVRSVKLRRSSGVAGAALLGTAAVGAGAALHRKKVEKSVFGAGKAARRASGAAKAHTMLASKYEAANRGRPGAVTAAAGTRFKSSTQLRRTRLNEARGYNAGNASFHREQAAGLVKKSAFGVELGDVEKGLGYGKLGRKAVTAAKSEPVPLKFKKPTPGVTPTGPGSQRGSMSASAWETRTAAARRSS